MSESFAHEDVPPQILLTTTTFNQPGHFAVPESYSLNRRTSHKDATLRVKDQKKHVRLAGDRWHDHDNNSSTTSVYLGSYGGNSPRTPRSRSRARLSVDESRRSSGDRRSPRMSLSIGQVEELLSDEDSELENYGIEEFREAFDATFLKPKQEDHDDLLKTAEWTLPLALRKQHPLSLKAFFPRQWRGFMDAVRTLSTTRAGVKLSKSVLGFFIAYVLCLVPAIRDWLGPYSYAMPISCIINHAGRPVGAQIDGTILTIIGTAAGLAWGALALWVSNATFPARRGYGGILAVFLIMFMSVVSALRSYYIRSYQLALTAGIAVIYTCLVDVNQDVAWIKLFHWGIPWALGQAICLLVACLIFPDGGARPLAVSLHSAFGVMDDALELPRPDPTYRHRNLAFQFVSLSQAYRDLTLDISITRFNPDDILVLRNLMQAVIRSLLSFKTETVLFDTFKNNAANGSAGAIIADVEGNHVPRLRRCATDDDAIRLVVGKLADPTMILLRCMREGLARCDAVLLGMSGYRRYLGPPPEVSTDVMSGLVSLRKAMIVFDDADDSLVNHPQLPSTFSDRQELVKLFLFVAPIRQASTTVEALLVKVMNMQQDCKGWRLDWPSYPFAKSLQKTNATVRHDRGGVTAGFFFRSQEQLAKQLELMQKTVYRPTAPTPDDFIKNNNVINNDIDHDIKLNVGESTQTARYKIWLILHRLQGFETRFALKVIIVTSLLAVPAWLEQSREWYTTNSSWWAVAFAWLLFHPRVGGSFQDLITRSLAAIAGAAWGGFAYAARDGDPYVIAVFAVIFMVPCIYRFTQSTHPRSGIVGCISFTVVSLSAVSNQGATSISHIAWTRGVAFVIGITSAIIVNWILWPFVARHELRKAISQMLLHLAIVYRGVVAKYIYYADGEEPSAEDIQQSELLEGRLREGFVRLRQLLALTRHEIRLRGPFNPLPYSALIENCESFFGHLVEVRQSSLFFQPKYMSGSALASESLLPFRRDAVAAILMNLYVLAGALRGNRKVPRYLPSAAVARKRLLNRMAELETELVMDRMSPVIAEGSGQGAEGTKKGRGRKFAEVYQFAYSQALTECVEQLEQLTKYCKDICGEIGFDPVGDEAYY